MSCIVFLSDIHQYTYVRSTHGHFHHPIDILPRAIMESTRDKYREGTEWSGTLTINFPICYSQSHEYHLYKAAPETFTNVPTVFSRCQVLAFSLEMPRQIQRKIDKWPLSWNVIPRIVGRRYIFKLPSGICHPTIMIYMWCNFRPIVIGKVPINCWWNAEIRKANELQ